MQSRPTPAGAVRLSQPVLEAGEEFEKALLAVVKKGNASEDDSQGHALSHNPRLRTVEERYMSFAARHMDNLRDLIAHTLPTGKQRAMATEVLGYAPDKQAVAPDLEFAIPDPDPDAVNNAMRALALIAGFEQTHPSLGIHVNPLPFVALLNSLVWSDRNKAAFALFASLPDAGPRTPGRLARSGAARPHGDGGMEKPWPRSRLLFPPGPCRQACPRSRLKAPGNATTWSS